MEVEIEGCCIEADDRSVAVTRTLAPGELYIARRSNPWKLLTCGRVLFEAEPQGHYVIPREMAYCFDTWHCHRVLRIDGEPTE